MKHIGVVYFIVGHTVKGGWETAHIHENVDTSSDTKHRVNIGNKFAAHIYEDYITKYVAT